MRNERKITAKNEPKEGLDRDHQPLQFQTTNTDTVDYPDDTIDVTPQTPPPKATDTIEELDETTPQGIMREETIVIMRMTEGEVNATINTDIAHQET